MFNVGDKIAFLDEVGIFTVTKIISLTEIEVEDEHGFDRICSVNDVSLHNSKAFDGVEISTFENRKVKVNPFKNTGRNNTNIPVVDLHIEHLLNAHGHMNNHQIVLFQLDVCKKEIDKKIKNGTTQFVIIHGVGSGKLKDEVRYLLNSYPNLEYMDEHYSGRGMGATKVFVK